MANDVTPYISGLKCSDNVELCAIAATVPSSKAVK